MNLKETERPEMSNAVLGSSISAGSMDDYQFINEFNFELIQNISENNKPASPSYIFNSSECKNIHEEIQSVAHGVSDILPRVITSPFTFLDVKILKDEYHAAAVTSTGSFVFLNLYNNHFQELALAACALSVVVVCRNDSVAIVKCKDAPVIFKIDMVAMKVIQEKQYEVNGIGKLSLSPGENFIFARVWEGKVLKIDLSDLENYSEIYEDRTMISMNTSPDSYIYIGTSDRRMLKLTESGQVALTNTYKFRIDAYIYFSVSGELVLLALKDSIKVLNSEDLEVVQSVFTGAQTYSLQLTVDENFIIAGLHTGELSFFSRFSKNSVRIRMHRSSITSVFTTRDSSIIYTFGTDSRLAVVYFPRLSVFKSAVEINFRMSTVLMASKEFEGSQNEEIFKPLCMALSDRKDIIIVGGESYNIAVWDRSTMRKNGELMGHLGFVYSLACLSDSIVASGGGDSRVILWNFRSLRKFGILPGHFAAVSAVVKIDNTRMASGSWDKTVQIWLWELQERLFTIKNLPDRIVALCTPKYNKLLIGMSNFIHCWDLLTYSVMFEKESESEIRCFRVLENTSEHYSSIYIGLAMDEDALWFEDPFLLRNLEVWGKNETGSYEFYYYLQGIIKKETVKYREDMDKYTVFPYKLNALHFYAYFNLPEHLYKAVVNGGALLNSVCGANPLSISIELGYKECIRAIVNAAWEKRFVNPNIISIVSVTTLNEMHLNRCPMLTKVYKLLMVTSISSIRPEQSWNFPLIKTSSSQFSYKKVKNGKKIKKVKIRKSVISSYIHPGTEKSINFLYSLSVCEDSRVLRTEFIQKLLVVKWRAVRFFVYFEFFIFFCHFLALVCYSVQNQLWELQLMALLLGVVLFGLELVTTVRVYSYLGVLCIVQGMLLIVWVMLEDDSKVFNSFLIIFSSLYGVNYFQIFEKSYSTLMFFQRLLRKITGFLPPFIYFVLFCFGSYYKFFDLFETFHQDYEKFYRIIDILAAFVVVLGFSCMLGGEDGKDASKSSYLLRIILKYELIMLWNRKDDGKLFIQVYDNVSVHKESGLKKVKRDLKFLGKQIGENLKEIKEKLPEIRENIKRIERSVKGIRRNVCRSSQRNSMTGAYRSGIVLN